MGRRRRGNRVVRLESSGNRVNFDGPEAENGVLMVAVVKRLVSSVPGTAPGQFERQRMDGTPDALGPVLSWSPRAQ